METKIVEESRLLYLKDLFHFSVTSSGITIKVELGGLASYLNTRRRQDRVITHRVAAVTRQTVTGITRLSVSGWLSATVWDTGSSLHTVRLDKLPMLTVFPETNIIRSGTGTVVLSSIVVF